MSEVDGDDSGFVIYDVPAHDDDGGFSGRPLTNERQEASGLTLEAIAGLRSTRFDTNVEALSILAREILALREVVQINAERVGNIRDEASTDLHTLAGTVERIADQVDALEAGRADGEPKDVGAGASAATLGLDCAVESELPAPAHCPCCGSDTTWPSMEDRLRWQGQMHETAMRNVEHMRQRAEAAERDNAQLAERLARAEDELTTVKQEGINAALAGFRFKRERDAAREALRKVYDDLLLTQGEDMDVSPIIDSAIEKAQQALDGDAK